MYRKTHVYTRAARHVRTRARARACVYSKRIQSCLEVIPIFDVIYLHMRLHSTVFLFPVCMWWCEIVIHAKYV